MTNVVPEASQAVIRQRLRGVIDPELDESIVELGFVSEIATSAAGDVRVRWRLPTYWCALNFVHLMAADMRRALIDLPWLKKLEICLTDHMAAAEINALYRFDPAGGQADEDPLPADLAGFRRSFLIKGFQRRQERLLRRLAELGHDLSHLLALDRGSLQALATDGLTSEIIARYFDRLEQLFGHGQEKAAFVDAEGLPLSPGKIRLHLRFLALVNLTGEINSAVCQGVLARSVEATLRNEGDGH